MNFEGIYLRKHLHFYYIERYLNELRCPSSKPSLMWLLSAKHSCYFLQVQHESNQEIITAIHSDTLLCYAALSVAFQITIIVPSSN